MVDSGEEKWEKNCVLWKLQALKFTMYIFYLCMHDCWCLRYTCINFFSSHYDNTQEDVDLKEYKAKYMTQSLQFKGQMEEETYQINWTIRREIKKKYNRKNCFMEMKGWDYVKNKVKHQTIKWSRSVMSNSLWPHGLRPTTLLHPWDFPGKNTRVGCHFLLQRIFPTQGSNLSLPHCRQSLYCLSHQGSF